MMHRSGHADAARATRDRIVAGRAVRLGLAVLLLPAAVSAQGERRAASLDDSRRTALVTAAERASPAVVSITVTSRQRINPRTPWDLLFVPRGSSRTIREFGTGFLIRPDGVILTNQHVVGGGGQIVVTLADGTEYPATLDGSDPIADIAVLRVRGASALPTVALGRSADLMVGEWVVALGNPYAYLLGNTEPTVTAGVVSATGRNILPSEEQAGLYLDMIQTDAAINPGNSGGPLCNALGEVVGVNSSILTSTGGSIGLGFAIPIERALRVAEDILANGSVRRAWTGLDVAAASSAEDWRRTDGVSVTAVAPGGPAARAGIRIRDVLVRAGARPLRNHLDWESVKLDMKVGQVVQLQVRSPGSAAVRTVALVSGDLPTLTAERVTVLRDLQLVSVTPAIQSERGLQTDQGALIVRIAPRTSEATGLREGDVILGVDRRRVASATDVGSLLNELRPGESFRLWIERSGQIAYSDLTNR
jgi:serine protease Do